jgi:hypothetical protein
MPGYKQWADGDVLTPLELDEYLVGQTLMRFANAAARTAALPAPTPGMRSYLTSDGVDYLFTAAGWIPVSPLAKIKPGDTTRASVTTRTNDPHLAGIALAVGTYRVEALLGVQSSSATPDFSLAWAFSGTLTGFRQTLGFAADGVTMQTLCSTSITAGTTYGTGGAAGSATIFGVRELMNVTVTVAGTLDMQWAQAVSNATGTLLSAGSSVVVQRLGLI